MLVIVSARQYFTVLLAAQCFFYTLGVLGWIFAHRDLRVKILYVPYYFLFMNAAVFAGFYRFLKGTQTVLWEKAKRNL